MQYKIQAIFIAISILLAVSCKAVGRMGGDAGPENTASAGGNAQIDIVGNPVVGLQLAADASKIIGSASSASFTYKWFRLGTDGNRTKVGDASAKYTPAAPDVGSRIMVSLDSSYSSTEHHSEPTAPVRWPPQSGTVSIESNGKALIPSTPLTAVVKDLSGTGAPFYLWSSGDIQTGFSPIPGAVQENYVITTGDVGKFIKVEITQSQTDGNVNAQTNSRVRELSIRGNVDINGTPEVAQTLTAVTSFDEKEITGYTWYAGGTVISGAVTKSYQLTAREQGFAVKVAVTRTGYGIIESPETAPVHYSVLGGTLSIAPMTGIQPGTVIKADTSGITGKNGNAIYEWVADSGVLSGAPLNDSSYTVVSADIGKKIRVKLSYEKSQGQFESAFTGTVGHTGILGSVIIQDDTHVDMYFRAILSQDYNGNAAFTTFTWYRNNIQILSGRGSSFSAYQLTNDDAGKAIKVVVTAPGYLSGSLTAEKMAPEWKSLAEVNTIIAKAHQLIDNLSPVVGDPSKNPPAYKSIAQLINEINVLKAGTQQTRQTTGSDGKTTTETYTVYNYTALTEKANTLESLLKSTSMITRNIIVPKITFIYTGVERTVTLMSDNDAVYEIELTGGSGGYVATNTNGNSKFDAGGKGGHVVARYTLPKGSVYLVRVGGEGGSTAKYDPAASTWSRIGFKTKEYTKSNAGGWPNGGAGGRANTILYDLPGGSGGGGSTDIRIHGTIPPFNGDAGDPRFMVAAGGGGAAQCAKRESGSNVPARGGDANMAGVAATETQWLDKDEMPQAGKASNERGENGTDGIEENANAEGRGGGGGGFKGGQAITSPIFNTIGKVTGSGAGGSNYVKAQGASSVKNEITGSFGPGSAHIKWISN